MKNIEANFLTTIGLTAQVDKNLTPNGALFGRFEDRCLFAGRSNSGKSTLLNKIMGAKLAHTSSTPGKTQALQLFWVGAPIRRVLVDVPGFGFAERSKQAQSDWSKLLDYYLKRDELLSQIFLCSDARHGPTDLDWRAFEYLSQTCPQARVEFVFTKWDLVKTQKERHERTQTIAKVWAEIGGIGEPPVVSSLDEKRTNAWLRRTLLSSESAV